MEPLQYERVIALKDSCPAYGYSCGGWYCVPDLDLDGQIVDDCVSGSEFDAEGGFVVLLEAILGEAQKHA